MKRYTLALIASLLILSTSCSKADTAATTEVKDSTSNTTDSIPSATYDITLLKYTTLFSQTPIIHTMANQAYNELSGIAASQQNPGILYVHDDNKNSPIAITDTNGNDLGTIVIDNASTVNPEDISVGPGPESGKTYIYLADIGDNNLTRNSIAVYRFEEPAITGTTSNTVIHVSADAIRMQYPSGKYNAESLLIDPISKALYIATKNADNSTIFKLNYPQSTSDISTLAAVAILPFDLLTSGDISADGKGILLRNKGSIYFWERATDQSVEKALLSVPSKAPYAGNEHQGEGVGFNYNASGYYTDTETKGHDGAVSNISFYPKLP